MRFLLIFTSVIILCTGFELVFDPFSIISVSTEIRRGIACLKSNIKRGNPAVGLPAFNPLNVHELTWNFDQFQAKYLSGYVTLYNFLSEGLMEWEFSELHDRLKYLPPGFSVLYSFTIPKFTMNGDYKLNVIFNGRKYFGRGHVTLDAAQITVSGKFVVSIITGITATDITCDVSVAAGQMQITGFMDDEPYSQELSSYLTKFFPKAVENNKKVIGETLANLLMSFINNRRMYEEPSGFNFAKIKRMIDKRCQPLPTYLLSYILKK